MQRSFNVKTDTGSSKQPKTNERFKFSVCVYKVELNNNKKLRFCIETELVSKRSLNKTKSEK